MQKKVLAVLFAAALIMGCSRKNFEAALSRSASSSEASQSQPSSSEPEFAFDSFDIGDGQMDEKNLQLTYAYPQTSVPQAQEAADSISAQIDGILADMPSYFDLSGEGALLTVFDGVEQNDSRFFSVLYEGEYTPQKDGEAKAFKFGMAFHARTGERVTIPDTVDAKALAALLLDEQSAKILTKKSEAELADRQRQYLSQQGAQALAELIEKSYRQETIADMMAFSFYVDGDNLAVVIAAPADLGGAIRISVPIPII